MLIGSPLPYGASHTTWIVVVKSSPGSRAGRYGGWPCIGTSSVVTAAAELRLPLLPSLFLASTSTVQLRPDSSPPTVALVDDGPAALSTRHAPTSSPAALHVTSHTYTPKLVIAAPLSDGSDHDTTSEDSSTLLTFNELSRSGTSASVSTELTSLSAPWPYEFSACTVRLYSVFGVIAGKTEASTAAEQVAGVLQSFPGSAISCLVAPS